MSSYFLQIVPSDRHFIPRLDAQIQACDFIADLLPERSGRWRGQGSIAEFPSVGDIDFTIHDDEAMANPYYVNQTRFSIAIDNHREILPREHFEQLELMLGCDLLQRVCEY